MLDNKTASWPILRRSRLKWSCFLPSSQQFKHDVLCTVAGLFLARDKLTRAAFCVYTPFIR